MNKLLASACAVAALSLTAPASAQSGALGDIIQSVLGGGSSSRIGNFDERIRVAYQRGEISDREARDLQNRYYDLRQREQSYRQNGLTQNERYDLQNRANELQRRLEQARYDGDRRERDRDWDDGDWSDGRNACPPGLRRKDNGCMPPGQVGRDDNRYRESSAYRNTDRYVWQQDRYGRMIQIDRRTGQVVRIENR
jgi:hypothetical protein